MKYTIGDKVTIKDDLIIGRPYGNCEFVVEMAYFSGDEVEISELIEDQNQYKIKEDGNKYFWHEKMFV